MTEVMTLQEVARYLRVTERTIYRLAKRGSLPGTKIGHSWRFDKASIDEWLHRKPVARKALILVVDDEDTIRVLFTKTLQELGHRVIATGTSSEGLELMKQLDFDLVFLDLKMPEMDGAELFRQIKAIKPRLPVTIITGYPHSDTMRRALAQGPLGIMRKPFDESDIIIAVDSFLRTGETSSRRELITQEQLSYGEK